MNTFIRGPPYNASKSFKNIDNELSYHFKTLMNRKTSKYNTLRNTFIRGPPNNAYKNSKNIDNELGYPLYYLQKLKNYKTNFVLMGEN